MYRIPALVLSALLVAVLASGCRQTRPIPSYEPLLALEAATPQTASSASEMYRPSWTGPRPKPKKGG